MTPAEQELAKWNADRQNYARQKARELGIEDALYYGYYVNNAPEQIASWASEYDKSYAENALLNNSPAFQDALKKFQSGELDRPKPKIANLYFGEDSNPFSKLIYDYVNPGTNPSSVTRDSLINGLNEGYRSIASRSGGGWLDNIIGAIPQIGFSVMMGNALAPLLSAATSSIASTPISAATTSAETASTLADLGLGGASYAPGATAVSAAVPTGGMFVGSSGALGGTGNAIIDGALNSAVSGAGRGVITSTLQGGDPLEGAVNGALSGAAFGGVSAALPTVTIPDSPLLTQAANGALQGSLGSGAAASVTGGDVENAMISGGLKGASMPVVTSLIKSPTLQATAKGALDGGINAGVNGGDILNGAVTGGMGGLGGSALSSWAGFDNGTIGNAFTTALGTVAGQVVGNEIAPADVPIPAAQPTANIPDAPTPGTMDSVGSLINPYYTGGLINNYQSLAVGRANQARD